MGPTISSYPKIADYFNVLHDHDSFHIADYRHVYRLYFNCFSLGDLKLDKYLTVFKQHLRFLG